MLGAFNCQGGGWDRKSRRIKSAAEFSNAVTAIARPRDVEWNSGKSPISVNTGDLFAVYSSRSGKLSLLAFDEGIEVSLEPFNCELFTVSPLKNSSNSEKVGIQFAPIGLVNMLNTGGAIKSLEYAEGEFKVTVKGAGEMKVYASRKPESCRINKQNVELIYDENVVSVQVPWPGSAELSEVEYFF